MIITKLNLPPPCGEGLRVGVRIKIWVGVRIKIWVGVTEKNMGGG